MQAILITGAGSGIGAAIAEQMAATCERLVLHTGSNAAGLELVAARCRAAGSEVETLLGDLGDTQTLDALVEAGQRAGVSGLVLNAGFPDVRAFGQLESADLAHSVQVMLSAPFVLIDGLLAQLQASGHGRVLAISSFLAHKFKVGDQVFPASASAKAALEAMIKSLAVQSAGSGLTANIIVPGYIKKNAPQHRPPDPAGLQEILDRIPAGRLGRPAEVAFLAAFLLGAQAAYITGQCFHIDGGLLLQ